MSLVLSVLLFVVHLSLFVYLLVIVLDWLEHESIISWTGLNLLLGDLVNWAALPNQAAVQLAHARDYLQSLHVARVSSRCGAVSLCERGAPDGALSEP